MVQVNHTKSNVYLESSYSPSGLITDVDIAVDVFNNAELSLPSMNSPYSDLDRWREFVDTLSPEVITALGETISGYDEAKFFKALSIKVDGDTPYTVEDILKVTLGPKESEKEKAEESITHVKEGYKYVLSVLPPVTAGMVGSFLGEVRAFDNHYYKHEFLPGEYTWGGLHYPYRGEIQMTTNGWNDFTSDFEYPRKSHTSSSTLIHEIGHTVHNLYGVHRPNDSGFEYPSEKHTLDSTGILPNTNLSGRQSEFVWEVLRSYSLNQRDAFKNIHRTGYGTTHPVESFACAFDTLLRRGGEYIQTEYEQFNDIFTLLI